MKIAERFSRVTQDVPRFDLSVGSLDLSKLELDGRGKRRYLRFWHNDGGCHTIDLMDGAVEVFVSGSVECASASVDDSDWTTQYSGPKFQVDKAQLWVYNGQTQDVVKCFDEGLCRPKGGHHHSLWANACVCAVWARLWVSS